MENLASVVQNNAPERTTFRSMAPLEPYLSRRRSSSRLITYTAWPNLTLIDTAANSVTGKIKDIISSLTDVLGGFVASEDEVD